VNWPPLPRRNWLAAEELPPRQVLDWDLGCAKRSTTPLVPRRLQEKVALLVGVIGKQ
jgi:hypothetical protein